MYVSNGNENTVTVIDTNKGQAIETINVGPTARAPQGSTPNALALDRKNNMLFVANADNNCIAVVNVREAGESHVMGFIPSGWYPSALLLNAKLDLLCAGINRHDVENERVLQERSSDPS